MAFEFNLGYCIVKLMLYDSTVHTLPAIACLAYHLKRMMDSTEVRPWKRRRRRRSFSTPVSAKLRVDESLKGDIGIISSNLFAKLYGSPENAPRDETFYVAVTPMQPATPHLEEDFDWTILAVKLEKSPSTSGLIQFCSSSLSLRHLFQMLRTGRREIKSGDVIEVRVLDVQPLDLEAVFVQIDGEALQKHDDVQKRFGGGFLNRQKNDSSQKGNPRTITVKGAHLFEDDPGGALESRLKSAVRSSLMSTAVVRSQDILPLPLPSHPITHVPFPPLQVIAATPVAQGLISLRTEVVIEIDYLPKVSKHKYIESIGKGTSDRPFAKNILEEDEDLTDQFYSAAENEDNDRSPNQDNGANQAGSSSESSDDDVDSLSDDSVDNVISLNSPTLPPQASGILSSKTAATPRPHSMRMNGIGTPGSVVSNYTSTTAHQGGNIGRSFLLKPLAAKVPDEFLYPKPILDEDNEARVFVDLKMLVRLGCFSGEWVKIITNSDPNPQGDRFWSLGSFETDEIHETFRPVKIYGLSDIGVNEMLQYPKTDRARRQSFNPLTPSSRNLPRAYISPILFANLGQPTLVTITPLIGPEQRDKKFSKPKLPSSSIPPIAKELTLSRINTPAALERAAFPGIFANLKQHFELRRRVVKEGDLIAIDVDAVTSRILSKGGLNLDIDSDLEELLLGSDFNIAQGDDTTVVVWFKVGRITGIFPDETLSGCDSDIWGDVASAEPFTTKMVQAGRECVKLPGLRDNPWPFYLGGRERPSSLFRKSTSLLTQEDLPSLSASHLQPRIIELLAASTSIEASHLMIKPLSLLLYSTQRGIGKTHLVSSACADLGLHFYFIDSYSILSDGGTGGDVKTEGYLRKKIEFAMDCGRFLTVPLIHQVEALTAERMATAIKDALQEVRAIVFTTTEREKIPESVRSLFTHEIEVVAPDESEREGLLRSIICESGTDIGHEVDISSVALKTAALVAGDLVDVVQHARFAKEQRLEEIASKQVDCTVRDVIISGGSESKSVTKADFEIAIEVVRKNFADSIGAPKIPNVTWDDVGGLKHVKDAVMETIQLPLERPELFSKGMKKRSGILFYGPPGTGKTLLAKAIATEFSLNFFSVKGPELLNMYIGESEANVRRVFQKAKDARPCVVFFDELDSVAPKRGNQGDSGGVMDRIVSQLLAELDGMSDGEGAGSGVFVIGATNRPDLLDQALLRPGRFDKMLYLGIADTHDKQLTILEALTRKFSLDTALSLRRVADKLPFTYTGADLYALCSDAMLKAITRRAAVINTRSKNIPGGPVSIAYFFDHYATEDDIAVTVTEEDFYEAQTELVSSVR